MDDALAPFVDVLASSLIIMVLVCLFFLIQTTSSISASARLEVVATVPNVDHFSPIHFREIIDSDMDNNNFRYVVNFELKDELIALIDAKISDKSEMKVIVESKDTVRKSTVNLSRFLQALDLPEKMKIKTQIIQVNSVLSTVRWELN